MSGTQKDMYNVDSYTDSELYNILDVNNPTDRELEAKILHMIWKYENMDGESADKLSNFFKGIYDRFFESENDDDDENNNDESDAKIEGMTSMNVPQTNNNAPSNSKNLQITSSELMKPNEITNQLDSTNRTFSYNIPIEYSKDNLNPLLKQTTKRIVVIDSQYRETKTSPSTNFTFNLSNPLRDVVSLKLYSFQIPYTWYTINKNYGSNFFILKGNTQGINDGEHDISLAIIAGNYTTQTLTTAVNDALISLQSNSAYLDICFGTTNLYYNNVNSKSKFTFDIKKLFNEGDYEIFFPYWDSPQTVTSSSEIIKSIPGFLGFNYKYYSPNVVYGLYNQLPGYSLPALAGAYSVGSNVLSSYQYSTTDETVSSYYLDASNNYFDIGITDRNTFSDPSNPTIYGGLRITLTRLATNSYYTRNELVKELNYELSVNPFLDTNYSKLIRVYSPLYMYYIDPYIFEQKKLAAPTYMQSPAYPYLYMPEKILNPFFTNQQLVNIPTNYIYYPLFTQPTIKPDPTNPYLILPNPFYNAKLLDPSANNDPIYPFTTPKIMNPFDPTAQLIDNPRDVSYNQYVDNPYKQLFLSENLYYMFYIDVKTLQSQNLVINPYIPTPTFPYLYLPKYIPNPFNITNIITKKNVYYPLYIASTVQPDPTNIYTQLPNPFYNPKILDISATIPELSFPFNTNYIPNPFDPNVGIIPNPYYYKNGIPNLPVDVSNNYMINPYYALASSETITWKYYIDSYTYLQTYNEGQGTLNTITSYVYLPTYPYMYLPQYIMNPFNTSNLFILQRSTEYAYWPLYTIPTIQPDPNNPSIILPNPFYNPQIREPGATLPTLSYPFNTQEIPNPFDPNGNYIPNPTLFPYINDELMINPYYALVTTIGVNYKYYIDSYTYTQQNLKMKPYSFAPTLPYLYVPQYILNPFNALNAAALSYTSTYVYYPLYTIPIIQPDPTRPSLILPNPFFNVKLLNPSGDNTPIFPFNTPYIPNPFDPNGGFIQNPYYFANNVLMINPYYALTSSKKISYKFYIDSYTFAEKSLQTQSYIISPVYPYLYAPKTILNPFASPNTITPDYPYYPLYTIPTIQPDPTNPSLILPNPFFNVKLLNPSADNTPVYPFNTEYIVNPFDPNGVGITNPFDVSNNIVSTTVTLSNGTVITVPPGSMVNPYYALTTIPTITTKYYIDSYTYIQQSLQSKPYVFSPLYPFLYVPQYILNPFFVGNPITPDYPYYPLFTQPTIQPDPMYHRDFILPNPFFNPYLGNPHPPSYSEPFPFNTSPYIFNPFDPNASYIPNPIDSSNNPVMLNPYYALVTSPVIQNKFYIDSYTLSQKNLAMQPYTSIPIYPYLYATRHVTNPFFIGTPDIPITPDYPYWPLYTQPTIQPDPTNPSLILPNPFFNAKLLDPTLDNTPIYPFNTQYIPNPFDPNGALIPHPYYLNFSMYIDNPYYPLLTVPTINYKFYIDQYTYVTYGLLTNNHYNAVPIYPYLYVPQYILNPFHPSNQSIITSTYPYWSLFTNPMMEPDPVNYPDIIFSNPYYNVKFIDPTSTTTPMYPFESINMPNIFDPNGGLIPNPYFSNQTMVINPYYALITTQTITFKYYIDSYTYAQKGLNSQYYISTPIYPYLYMPTDILNPFNSASQAIIDSSYPYWPLFTQPLIQPDPQKNPNLFLPNPFFNAKLLNPFLPNTPPQFPFNTPYILNPFNPTGDFIPSPYYTTENTTMKNPYLELISSQAISYKYYIDLFTFQSQPLYTITYYIPSPIFPFLYCPTTILNPFNPTNQSSLQSSLGPSNPYYPLFIQPLIQPDPVENPTVFIPNPFYNPKILNPASQDPPSYTDSTITNYFDPIRRSIKNPYYYSNEVTMVNPYSAIFIESSEIPHSQPIIDNVPTDVAQRVSFPNPYYNSHAITNNNIVPTNINNVTTVPNPGYNPAATLITDTNQVPTNINNVLMIPNASYNSLISDGPTNINDTSNTPNPAYNPGAITDNDYVPTDINNVTTVPNPGYNSYTSIITDTNQVPTNINDILLLPNPGYNKNANYDISNNDITQVGISQNPAYNPNANFDICNNDATKLAKEVNPVYNSKAIYDIQNQFTDQIQTISNPFYNPMIHSEYSNPVNNWIGSSFSHYELRLKLNRMTMPIVNSAYSKKSLPNIVDQKITVKFPNDNKIWLGAGSAFLFNPLINPYPLSLMTAESTVNESNVIFRSIPTINFKCVKKYYDISQNNYTAYINPDIDTCGNIVHYSFTEYVNNINYSLVIMNNNSVNPSNQNGVFKIGANPSFTDTTSSNTLFYKNADSKLDFSVDMTKTFDNVDYYLDLGSGNLIKSLGLTNIQILTGYDNFNNVVGPIIYTDVSKNDYVNSQKYGGYGLDFSGNFWVAVGQGNGNTIVYSDNSGDSWNACTVSTNLKTDTLFTVRGNKVKYSGNQWTAVGKSDSISGNNIAYSTDGITWTGLGSTIFSVEANGLDYNSNGNVWVAAGQGGNIIAYTNPAKSFVNSWSGVTNFPFDSGTANNVYWDNSFNMWVATGTFAPLSGIEIIGNTIVTSKDGIEWIPASENPFGENGIGYNVSCNGNIWVAVGASPTENKCIAYALPIYSQNGVLVDNSLNWIPVSTGELFKYGAGKTISYNGEIWVVGGNGVDVLATSIDGKVWQKEPELTTNANYTFIEGINDIKWTGNAWTTLGNSGFSGNSVAYSLDGNYWSVGNTQPFPSGLSIKTTYNIDLASNPTDNSLTLFGTFPVKGSGYTFIAGNFITLIPKAVSANKFSERELINIEKYQADAFLAPDLATLAALVNDQFSIYQDGDGDYVLNGSYISLSLKDNVAYAVLKIVVKKYITQKSYNVIFNDTSDTSFNLLQNNPNDISYNDLSYNAYLWQNSSNTWWNYLKIPYWNYPLYTTTDSLGNKHYIVCGQDISGQLINKQSVSVIQNMSSSTVRQNTLTIRDKSYTDNNGTVYPVNNKIIIQPQTVLPNPITSGTTNLRPNSNPERIVGWNNIDPISGLTTTNVADSTSVYNGYGYNTIVMTIPNGDYSSDELVSYINNQLNASPYIPVENQIANPLLTYNGKNITFGSGFNLLPIPGVGIICQFLFNVNMIYNAGDYLLDFFDPYGFSKCSNVSNNVQNTNWDSTLGWILGFRAYTEYVLSSYKNDMTTNNILQIIANNIANGIFSVSDVQIQGIVEPALQSYIVTLESDTAVSVNIYNYFLITLDDFNQSHLNDGLVTTSKTETDIPLPSYANRAMLKCDPITQKKTVSNINTNSTANDRSVTNVQRNLTQKQTYAAQEILNSMQSNTQTAFSSANTVVKQNLKYYSNGPFAQDVFALVPLKLAGQQNNTVYIDYSGTLQNQERVYFGPVNIQRMSVSLVNDRGELVDLNGANWSFSLICEQLYQQKKT